MEKLPEHTCPICKLVVVGDMVKSRGDRIDWNCPRCGPYQITRSAEEIAKSKPSVRRLSAWIRDRKESDAKPPVIDSYELEELEKLLPKYRATEKQLLLLRAMERRSEYPGKYIKIQSVIDYPLGWADNEKEFRFLVNGLTDRKLISLDQTTGQIGSSNFLLQITPDGWGFLEQHEKPSIISNQAFVAMSFSAELKPAWANGIKKALKKARFSPYRTDAEPHIDRIDTKIISEIKNSRFLVADVTEQRPGVYFEAGFAIGLGLPVFWSVRKDDFENVHFDTRQYNHIVWKDEEDLKEQLYWFVTALVGKGTAEDSD